ncbi:MAG: hypothetical protein IT262_10375 [Saprospiraceae bacterium]|jgi:hypothetical protein|nr:hypothetical protein [Saprospiraceae bacterium]
MENESKFTLPNWEKITDKTAALLYSEAEKRLQETVSTFNIHTDKAFRILSLSLPSITLVAGFIVYSTPLQQSGINWPAITFISLNIMSVLVIIRLVLGHTIHVCGSLPRDNFDQSNFESDTPDTQYIGWIITLAERIQDKINHNTTINNRRADYLNYAMLLSGVAAPALSFIVFLFSR